MQYATLTALRAHTDAIQAWIAADAMPNADPVVVASWVGQARQRSAFAIGTHSQLPGAILRNIEAACTDAEVEAAIHGHASAIRSLSMVD